MPKKLPGRWRGEFVRALERTGNVRVSARRAGVDPGTAYDHRIKDGGFAARWETALAKARARPSPRPSPRSGRGGELVARTSTRHGTQWVRAAHKRWSARAEAAFVAELERTGCVRAAARACGLSTTALYRRRKNYPDFAQVWAAAEAKARERIPALLAAATLASLDPDIEREEGVPAVDVAQAIAICRMKGMVAGPLEGRGRNVPEAPPIEEVRDEVLRRLEAIRRHREGRSGDASG